MANIAHYIATEDLTAEEAQALTASGLTYAMGSRGQQDHSTAVSYFLKAARVEHPDALYNLSLAYEYGLGVPKNPACSMEYQLKASQRRCQKTHDIFYYWFKHHTPAQESMIALRLRESENSPGYCFELGLLYEAGLIDGPNYQLAYQYYQHAACRGFDAAMNRLGYLFENGLGVTQDVTQAFEWYRQAAEQGGEYNYQAQFNLGRCYRQGLGCSVDLERAEERLRQALRHRFRPALYEYTSVAAAGFAPAQTFLGDCYLYGYLAPEDRQEGYYWIQLAAEQDHPEASYHQGWCFFNGRGVSRNRQQAFTCFLKSAQLGYSGGQHLAGFCFRDGLGVTQNDEQALRWFSQAALQGHADAKASVGFCHLNGKGVRKNYQDAFSWFNKAAEQGSGWGKYGLGLLYEKGLGVAQSYSKAIECYQQAHRLSKITPAQTRLGFFYAVLLENPSEHWKALFYYAAAAKKGDINAAYNAGVLEHTSSTIDTRGRYGNASEFYRLAAEAGDAAAQNNLGVLYANGKTVDQDHPLAFQWYKSAADVGNCAALFNLACCYQLGLGVLQDYQIALSYYHQAAQQPVAAAYNNLGVFHALGLETSRDSTAAERYFLKAVKLECAEAKTNLGILRKAGPEDAFVYCLQPIINLFRCYKKIPPKNQKVIWLQEYLADESIEQDQI